MNMASIKAMTRIACLSAPGYEGAVAGVAGAFDVVCDCISASAVAPLPSTV
jgi:hypothetical protein